MVDEFRDYLKEYSYDNNIIQNEFKREVESFEGLHVLVLTPNEKVVAESPADILGLEQRLGQALHELGDSDLFYYTYVRLYPGERALP
jgi:hypothetical protein